jgi:hypothetical protein
MMQWSNQNQIFGLPQGVSRYEERRRGSLKGAGGDFIWQISCCSDIPDALAVPAGDWHCIKAGGYIASTFKVIRTTVQWGHSLVTLLFEGSRMLFGWTLYMWHRIMVFLVERMDVHWGPIGEQDTSYMVISQSD